MSAIDRSRPHSTIARRVKQRMPLAPPNGKTINTYLPMEILKEIFLYSTESNQTKSSQLVSVCRRWRSIIIAIPQLWCTLRVGTWTGTEQVTTWFRRTRVYPKKVTIDTQRDSHRTGSSGTLPFSALRDALQSTCTWHGLTILSFPPENVASQLGFQVASPMNALRVLNVAGGCVRSPSFTHLLGLVPTKAPLSELRLHSSFAAAHFLQPHWFHVLQNLTVLIVNGRDVREPFELLPTFTQLQIFEADGLHLPWYEPDTDLPLLLTLRKLRLRSCSVRWMAGRVFPCLEECFLLPHHWEGIQQLGVHLPFCNKLTYDGDPMTTVRYFHVPKGAQSHNCKEQ